MSVRVCVCVSCHSMAVGWDCATPETRGLTSAVTSFPILFCVAFFLFPPCFNNR